MYYVWVEKGDLICEQDKERVKALYGITREEDAIISDEEYEKHHGLVRLDADGNVFLGYTEDETKNMTEAPILEEIRELKDELSSTDYVAAKIGEGAATKEEYADVLARRQECRNRINELESQLK